MAMDCVAAQHGHQISSKNRRTGRATGLLAIVTTLLITAVWSIGHEQETGAVTEDAVQIVSGPSSEPLVRRVLSQTIPKGHIARRDDLLDPFVSSMPADIRALHAAFERQPDYIGSAAGMEEALATELRSLGATGVAFDRMRVRCRASMCEVAGLTGPGRGEQLEQGLRSPAVQDSIATWGMVPGPVGRVETSAGRAFLFYVMVPRELASKPAERVVSGTGEKRPENVR